MLYAVILFTVFVTSVLSGILGMAGGMILMAVLVSTLSVATAMILHGAAQATANGSRAWFLRQHINWAILPPYSIGAGIALAGFTAMTIIPLPGVVLILVGLFPWAARANIRLRGLNVLKPMTTIVCGGVVTSAQLLAGASGPLLDVFYLNAPLNRLEIVANKALTQALGHILKIIYYALLAGVGIAGELSVVFILLVMSVAVGGTRAGTWVLERWDDEQFQKISQIIILTIATICVAQGICLLL